MKRNRPTNKENDRKSEKVLKWLVCVHVFRFTVFFLRDSYLQEVLAMKWSADDMVTVKLKWINKEETIFHRKWIERSRTREINGETKRNRTEQQKPKMKKSKR